MGIKIELEHTENEKIAREIATDHLVEDPEYYNKLKTIEESTNKSLIKKLLIEAIELLTIDESPDTTEYEIKYNDRLVGKIKLGQAPSQLGDDTMELIGIGYRKDHIYLSMKLTIEVIRALWKKFNSINRIVLQPKAESRGFWAKMGATRLNDTFYMLNRGH